MDEHDVNNNTAEDIEDTVNEFPAATVDEVFPGSRTLEEEKDAEILAELVSKMQEDCSGNATTDGESSARIDCEPFEEVSTEPVENTSFSEADNEEALWKDIAGETGTDDAPVEEPGRTVSGRGGFWKVLGIILLILFLALATLAVFFRFVILKNSNGFKMTFGTNGNEHTFSYSSGNDDSSGNASANDGFGWILPDDSGNEDAGSEDGGMPDDKEDFFNSYYTGTDTVDVNINIERAKLPIKFEMELEEPGTEELSLQELYAECSQSVVAIMGYSEGAEFSWGTGVILSSNGLIITNTHVIDACDKATVILWNDEEYDALLVGADVTSDIAVLKIDAKKLPAAHYSTSDSLVVGDPVAAIGNPLGESFRATLTNGIISGIDRGVSYNGRTMTVLQTNTALNSGNSGGPLFNMFGQVIGITNMKMMSSYSSIEGIGFAIPTKTVNQIVNGLVKDGEFRGRPSIGMTVGAIPDNAKEHYSLPGGLYITDITSGSGADKAGLVKGDIVTEVNGIPVETTDDVLTILEDFSVGDMLPVTVWRDGTTLDFEIELMDTNDIYG